MIKSLDCGGGGLLLFDVRSSLSGATFTPLSFSLFFLTESSVEVSLGHVKANETTVVFPGVGQERAFVSRSPFSHGVF